ncbi:MAG: alkaline phosphatase family protein [Bacteroidales bacterium]|nr:alkaline phosphatase family protein [Bacteroidales bacterium]
MKRVFLFVYWWITVMSICAQETHFFTPEKPKLIVGVVVQQMRYDYIQRYWEKLGEDGFKRLINEGALCKNANYNYAFTQSASGHATIVTGTNPAVHGIISDTWYSRLKKTNMGAVSDNDYKTIGGNYNAGNVSPKNLMTSTFTDELRLASYFSSKIISISLDGPSAVLLSGHISNAAYWYDDHTGNWISSSYYMDSLPAWVNAFNQRTFADVYLEREWNTTYPISKYLESLYDGNEYEIGIKNQKVFPYDLESLAKKGRKQGEYSILKYTPFGNMYTKDMAISAIMNEELGKDEATDVLMVSFAATEYIGNVFGPTSIEMEDAIIRLDQDIAHLLKFLDEQIGKKNLLVFLTSDNGMAYNPQYLIDLNMPAGSFLPNKTIYLLQSYLRALYGTGEWVETYMNKQIYLNRTLIEDSKIPLEEIQMKSAQFLLQFNTIANAVTSQTLETTNFSSGVFQKMQNSFNQERSGDILINLRPGWVEKSPDKVSEHNSPYTYDTHVPLIFYGWKITHKSIEDFVDVADIAPTVSMLLDIPFPNGFTGKPIMMLTK